MGQYNYGGRRLKRTANWALYGVPASLSAYLVLNYMHADSGGGFFGFVPPHIRPYVLAGAIAAVVGFAYAVYRRMLGGPKIEGEIRIAEGWLLLPVQRGNRTETVELNIRELTFVENEDERMRIASPQDEYIFDCLGFAQTQDYEKFRMEMTCEKFKK